MLRESTDINETTSDDELSDWHKEDKRFTQDLVASRDKIDKRMIVIYKLRKAY